MNSGSRDKFEPPAGSRKNWSVRLIFGALGAVRRAGSESGPRGAPRPGPKPRILSFRSSLGRRGGVPEHLEIYLVSLRDRLRLEQAPNRRSVPDVGLSWWVVETSLFLVARAFLGGRGGQELKSSAQRRDGEGEGL